MSRDTFAIFAERFAQREQPYEGCWGMKIEGKSGRSQPGQRNRAEKPDGYPGEQDPRGRGRDGQHDGQRPR
jgi:hypothetical protein